MLRCRHNVRTRDSSPQTITRRNEFGDSHQQRRRQGNDDKCSKHRHRYNYVNFHVFVVQHFYHELKKLSHAKYFHHNSERGAATISASATRPTSAESAELNRQRNIAAAIFSGCLISLFAGINKPSIVHETEPSDGASQQKYLRRPPKERYRSSSVLARRQSQGLVSDVRRISQSMQCAFQSSIMMSSDRHSTRCHSRA